MSAEIAWYVEITVNPAALDRFRALTHEMVEFAKTEPGTLIYERFLGDDGQSVFLYERYVDAAAALAHLTAFSERYGERFTRLIERRRFVVFGSPSVALRQALDRFGAIYGGFFDGFARGSR